MTCSDKPTVHDLTRLKLKTSVKPENHKQSHVACLDIYSIYLATVRGDNNILLQLQKHKSVFFTRAVLFLTLP